MRKLFFLILFTFVISHIFAEQNEQMIINDSKKYNKFEYNTNLSLGFASGISFGVGKTEDYTTKAIESSVNYHYHYCHYFYSTGLYYQVNVFNNLDKNGFYYLLSGGVDYTKGEKLLLYTVGGPQVNPEKYEGIAPNIFLGLGYSFYTKNNVNYRIFWDFGIKKALTNFNFSINY